MYLSVVRVFNPYVSRYMLKFALMGWGKYFYTDLSSTRERTEVFSRQVCFTHCGRNIHVLLEIELDKCLEPAMYRKNSLISFH